MIKVLKVLFYTYMTQWKNDTFAGSFYSDSKIKFKAYSAVCVIIIAPLWFVYYALSKRYGFETDVNIPVVVAVFVCAVLYFLLIHNGRWREIYEEKPCLFNTRKASRVFTAAFTAVSLTIVILSVLYLES